MDNLTCIPFQWVYSVDSHGNIRPWQYHNRLIMTLYKMYEKSPNGVVSLISCEKTMTKAKEKARSRNKASNRECFIKVDGIQYFNTSSGDNIDALRSL